MSYVIAFLEGVITFISPCLLPVLPIYISYFAGGGEQRTAKTITNATGFIIGFTTVFVLLGALAGSLGQWLNEYRTIVNIVTGAIVVLFGLAYLGVFRLSIFKGSKSARTDNLGFFSSVIFGLVFSVGWTPCVGVFLGSALMLATEQGHMIQGILMLLVYSLGLGIPFFVSAILIDKLKTTFSFIKQHYAVINTVSGVLLIVMGVLMATGLFNRLMTVLA